MRRVLTITTCVLVLVGVAGVWSPWAEDLGQRIDNLWRKGRYELARQILEDWRDRGEVLSADLEWQRARLQTDPDRFDALAHGLIQNASASDPRRVRWTTARAKEHFAQGRYQTAADLLDALGPEARLSDPDASLFLAMAWEALGQAERSRTVFQEIPRDHPASLAASSQRAALALRAGEVEEATRLARRLLEENETRYGAQARLFLALAAERRGDTEAAARWRRELREKHPSSVESTWQQPTGSLPAREEPPAPFREVEAPDPRRSFALQLGAFRDRSLALRFARRSVGVLDDLRVEVDRSEEPPWYRVVGGEYTTRSAAQRERQRLEAEGISSLILGLERGPR